MFVSIVTAVLSIYKAYNEYKQSRDTQKLLEFYELQKVENAKIVIESNIYTSQEIVQEEFDDLQVKINSLTALLDLMVKNPRMSYLSDISSQAVFAQYSVDEAIRDVIEYEGTLTNIEGLLVTAVANAGSFYALCAASTVREEQLDPTLNLSYLRQSAKDLAQRNAELAMTHLRRCSDLRFRISSRPGEPIPGGRHMLVYGYTFNGRWYSDGDEAYPGRDNSRIIAIVRTKMVEHQNSEFPKYPGVADIDQIIAQLPPD